MEGSRSRFVGPAIALMALALTLTNASPLFGQSWTSRKGTGSVSLSYQDLYVKNHLFNTFDGVNHGDFGHIFGRTVTASLDYSVLDRLALGVTVPYVVSKYAGPYPEDAIDNGHYHGGFQDLSVAARYRAFTNPLTITPSISYSVPLTDYSTLGHTAIGAHLRTFNVGLHAGRTLAPLAPEAYVEASYFRAFAQEHVMQTPTGEEVHRLRHNFVGLQIGYFITPALSVAVVGNYEDTHGGIDWNTITSEEEGHEHDPLAAAIVRTAGGGVTYSLTRSVDLQFSMAKVISGVNTHQAETYSIGTSWDLGSILRLFKGNNPPARDRSY